MSKDFDELTKDDPIVKNNRDHPGYVKLQERKSAYKAAEVNVTVMRGAREGILPPGVRQESWMDDDKAFSYAVAVYLPSVSEQARDGQESMKNGVILTPSGGSGQKPSVKEDVKQGPSGVVQDPNDL
jgi:hypothetical protein